MNSISTRRCIIHVGMHKTGTTTIQGYLARHLKSAKFAYAQICGDANHSSRIFSLFSSKAGNYHLNRKKGWEAADIHRYNEETRQSLQASIEGSAAADFIISGEDISELDEESLVRLKSFFEPHFGCITIAAYVRSPLSYMDSNFQQKMKWSQTRFDVAAFYPNYRWRFEKFDKVFGRDQVLLWKFDPEGFVNQCVMSDFGSRFGISVDPAKVVRTNESLSRNALALLYVHQKFGPGFRPGPQGLHAHRRLINALAQIGGEKVRLARTIAAPVLTQRIQDIAWMEQRLGTSLDDQISEGVVESISLEEDLLTIEPASIEALKELVGAAHLPPDGDGSPEYIALLVEALRTKLTDDFRRVNRR